MSKKIFLVGDYGSGKTSFAVSFAIAKHITKIADLDTLNPFFRSRDKEELLKKYEIRVYSSTCKETKYMDMPLIDSRIYKLAKSKEEVIFDMPGSKIGAGVVKQFDFNPSEVEVWLVFNTLREETNTKQKLNKIIETLNKNLPFEINGLVFNPHLLNKTTKNFIDMELEKVKKWGLNIKYYLLPTEYKSSIPNKINFVS